MLSVGLLVGFALSADCAEDGLVLHLSFDDRATIGHDGSGCGNHGVPHGEPTWVEAGVRGGALRMDGVDDYFDCGNAESLHLGTDDFTFEVWLKTDTRDTYMLIASTGRYGIGFGHVGLAIRAHNVLSTGYRCRHKDRAIAKRTRQAPPTLPPVINRQPINNGRWHHIAVVVDRESQRGVPRLYRDGIEVTGGVALAGGPLPATAIMVTNSDPLLIGASCPKRDRFYNGLIDEVKLYRRALREDEIKQHWQTAKPAQEPPPPLPEPEIEMPEVTKLNWKMDHFVIMPWGGPSLEPEVEGHDALPEVIKEAHFNTVLCTLDKLELCRKWGFKALLAGVSAEKTIELRNDRTVWGYLLKDEPREHREYPELARRMQQFREADPNHVGYINLGGSLNGTHPLYLDIVKPDLLSFDYYQWSWGQADHFPRLEEYRQGAQDHGIPLMVWVHGNAGPPEIRKHDYYYHAPDNQARMRHSVFTSLAYGAKGIQWFHGKHLFAGDRLRPNGRDVAAINAELQKLGPALVGLRSVEVYHTPPLPPATREIPKGFWIQITGGEFVLGLMEHPAQPDADYFMLANRDHTRGEEASLKLTRLGITVEKMDKKKGEWESQTVTEADGLSRVTFPVGAGDGELLRVR